MEEARQFFKFLDIITNSFLETLRTNLSRKNDISELSLFFVFSFGRSGTQFFSKLLNSDPKALIFHEPLKRDVLEHMKSFKEGYDYDLYIKKFRIKFIQSIIKLNNSNREIKVYGECNSYLRRHAGAIMSLLPNVKGLYVIRDGRNVVRSMMSRSVMLDTWYYNNIKPKYDDPYFKKWGNWGRFEKCCWYWASENKKLYKQLGTAIQFELLLTDYDYFKSKMLDVLKIEISKTLWENERKFKSANKTSLFKCPSYEDWPSPWKDSFWKICGNVMANNGYF